MIKQGKVSSLIVWIKHISKNTGFLTNLLFESNKGSFVFSKSLRAQNISHVSVVPE